MPIGHSNSASHQTPEWSSNLQATLLNMAPSLMAAASASNYNVRPQEQQHSYTQPPVPQHQSYSQPQSSHQSSYYQQQHQQTSKPSYPPRKNPRFQQTTFQQRRPAKPAQFGVPVPTQWRCTVCDCDVPLATKDDHIGGKKHQSKLKTDKAEINCDVCDLKLSSENYAEHLRGKRHLKNAQQGTVPAAKSSDSGAAAITSAAKPPSASAQGATINIAARSMAGAAASAQSKPQSWQPLIKTDGASDMARVASADAKPNNASIYGPTYTEPLSDSERAALEKGNGQPIVARLETLHQRALLEREEAYRTVVRLEGESADQYKVQLEESLTGELQRLEQALEAELEAVRNKFHRSMEAARNKCVEDQTVYASSRADSFQSFQARYEDAVRRLKDACVRDVAAAKEDPSHALFDPVSTPTHPSHSTNGPSPCIRMSAEVEAILDELFQAEEELTQSLHIAANIPGAENGGRKRPYASLEGDAQSAGTGSGAPDGKDAMQLLHEMCKKAKRALPLYDVTRDPTNMGLYRVTVTLDGIPYGEASHGTQRVAQHMAANATLQRIWGVEGTVPACKTSVKRVKPSWYPMRRPWRGGRWRGGGSGGGAGNGDGPTAMDADGSGVAEGDGAGGGGGEGVGGGDGGGEGGDQPVAE